MDMFLIASVVVAGANEQSAEGFKWMPVPSAFRMTQGTFRLDTTFTVSVEGAATLRQYRAAARMLRRLSDRTGLFFSQNILSPSTNPSQPSMSITASHQGRLEPGEDESYTLEISGQSIRLSAESDIGTLRGMETFLQLLDADGQGYFFPCVSVEDRPRFSWRGLLIDAGRHFMPVDVILRNLDGMATVKLNVLHWHLTDDQGFRVECKTHPKLHELGSDGQYYTHEQIRRVVAYAADRGIRVMPEFDIPGHSTAWFVGYPELASASGQYEIERHWGVFKPTMDPTRGSTYNFLDGFFKEMAGLFPDAFIHIGGDEVEGSAWKESPAIQAFMKKNHIPDNHALQTYFNLRIQKILV
ncbi:MAG TPA: family 20 glycosylhydrolase, partial [bacterium]